MFDIPSWLLVFPVLGFLIFIHELGHCLTAKWFGITVKEFGFGFPPRLIGFRFSPNGTIYSLNWIPLGGFVRMVGEHGEAIEEGAYMRQKPEKNVILVRGQSDLPDLYGIFGVPRDASQEEIRRSYVELTQLVELRSPERRDRMLHGLQAAYGRLSNPEDRAKYDELIKDVEMERPEPPDYYGLFDVPVDATQEQIDEGRDMALLALERRRHRFENPAALRRYIEYAHEELSDADRRAAYDRRMRALDPGDVSFSEQSVIKRVIVLCAGSFVNLLFPLLVFAVMFALPHDAIKGTVVVTGVAPNSPAQQAGITSGDMIVAMNGNDLDTHADLVQQTMSNLGAPTELTVRRGVFVSDSASPQPTSSGVEVLTLTPRMNPPDLRVVDQVSDPSREVSLAEARRYQADLQVGDTLTQGAIGVLIGTVDTQVVTRRYPITEAIPRSFQQMWDVLAITRNGIARWIGGGPDPGLSGPVGIAYITGEVAERGISPLLQLTAIISISLGIVNILPIPALDGGRLMFVLIEWARGGKPISPRREGMAHLIGFVVLIGLIVVISYFDIVRLISGEGFLR